MGFDLHCDMRLDLRQNATSLEREVDELLSRLNSVFPKDRKFDVLVASLI